MRKGITILFFGMLALSAPPSANRLWGQTEKKDVLPDPPSRSGTWRRILPSWTPIATRCPCMTRGKKNVVLAFYIFAFTGG